ncbi:hypothetical protein HII36_40140 [Nonomuraea sp. NN258]|uniref:hypothetical protein n=1 Tax=Nonomuraea antri TaxID=2730852 RepID=UPI00156A1E8D|nr:hypothetical protein [Nonomuraea antri]NRQ37998.1 hypothetical protein [Nonomuraea antri]
MIVLAGDDRTGVLSGDWEVADPGEERIAEAVGALDGQRRTEVSVTDDEPFRYLSVAGGPHLYLVTGESADGEILQLTEPGAGREEARLVCGGQLGVFERSGLVTREAALAAVADFLAGFPRGFGPEWSIE